MLDLYWCEHVRQLYHVARHLPIEVREWGGGIFVPPRLCLFLFCVVRQRLLEVVIFSLSTVLLLFLLPLTSSSYQQRPATPTTQHQHQTANTNINYQRQHQTTNTNINYQQQLPNINTEQQQSLRPREDLLQPDYRISSVRASSTNFMGAFFYYDRLQSFPIPAIPPYVAKTPHVHGTRTTADNT